MTLQKILDNNPKAFVTDWSLLTRDVYDVINRHFIREDTMNELRITINTTMRIPDYGIDMVTALMTSTTPFCHGHDSLTFYARNMIWHCTKNKLTCTHLIPEQYQPYFDDSPLRVYMGNGFAYAHQAKNVLLITKCYEMRSLPLPNHVLIILPETFAILSLHDYYYSQAFAVRDNTTQQLYHCDLQFRWDSPTPAECLKVSTSPADDDLNDIHTPVRREPIVDIGIRVVVD